MAAKLRRSGHRYYDPKAKRFLTPDNYFMEQPSKIVGSPWEGGLYGYAMNNPVNFIDPTGKFLMNLTFHAFFTAPAASGGEFVTRFPRRP